METPIILLHGALGTSLQLADLKKQLSNNFKVYSFDFEGHGGRSSQRDFSMEAFTENLIEFMDSHTIQSAHIFGYSMGGYVALKTSLMHQHRINSIYTYGTKFNWTPESAERETRMLNADKILDKVPQFAAHLEKLHGEKEWKTVLEKTAILMRDLGNGKAFNEKELKAIQIPVKLSIGTKDHMVTIEETEQVSTKIPTAEILILEDWEHPIEKIDAENLAKEFSHFIRS